MQSIYLMCKKLIESGKMTQIKLDVYLANDRLTAEEYEELCDMLNA